MEEGKYLDTKKSTYMVNSTEFIVREYDNKNDRENRNLIMGREDIDKSRIKTRRKYIEIIPYMRDGVEFNDLSLFIRLNLKSIYDVSDYRIDFILKEYNVIKFLLTLQKEKKSIKKIYTFIVLDKVRRVYKRITLFFIDNIDCQFFDFKVVKETVSLERCERRFTLERQVEDDKLKDQNTSDGYY